MSQEKKLWSNNHKLLKELLLKPDKFDEAIALFLEQHAWVHSSEMSHISCKTFEDELWEGLEEPVFHRAVNSKMRTIAYGIWHSTRIEDITMNILVKDEGQVINTNDWPQRINANICDTGNAMNAEEIMTFSSHINMRALQEYRIAVGRQTREVVQGFTPEDLKRKMEPKRLQRILDEGAVLNVEAANWLIDFWGRKNVAGILLMPATRHHMVHINESMSAKNKGGVLCI